MQTKQVLKLPPKSRLQNIFAHLFSSFVLLLLLFLSLSNFGLALISKGIVFSLSLSLGQTRLPGGSRQHVVAGRRVCVSNKCLSFPSSRQAARRCATVALGTARRASCLNLEMSSRRSSSCLFIGLCFPLLLQFFTL